VRRGIEKIVSVKGKKKVTKVYRETRKTVWSPLFGRLKSTILDFGGHNSFQMGVFVVGRGKERDGQEDVKYPV